MPTDREMPKDTSSNALDMGVKWPRYIAANEATGDGFIGPPNEETQDMNKDVYEITEWQIGRRFSVKGFDFELDLKSHLHSVGITATWGTKHKMKGFWSLRSGVVLTSDQIDLTEREEQAIGEVCARLWVEEHPTDILKK